MDRNYGKGFIHEKCEVEKIIANQKAKKQALRKQEDQPEPSQSEQGDVDTH